MGKPNWAVLAATGVMAALAGGASGADHRYYVSSANAQLASVIDLASQTRTGDVVSFDLMLLRRQPIAMNGVTAYWADGVEEVDCAGHRRRVMLLAGLSLDRSRKANQTGARFEAWEASAPGTFGRATEDFVCHAGPSPPLTPVADLAAFQRDFFQRGPQVAQAPAAPAPSPARAAIAPDEGPGSTPPSVATAAYYALGESDGGEMIIEAKDGIYGEGLVNASIYVIRGKPTAVKDAPFPVYWMAGDIAIKCRERQWHMVLSSLGNLERTQFATIPNVRFSDWTPIVAGSNVEKAETLVCRNKLAPGVRPLEDLTAYGRQRAAAAKPPAQTAATPSPAAQRPPGSKDVYVAGMVSKQIVVLIDKSSFKRQGDILTYSRLDIYPTPERFHGAVIYWDEATMQTDCKMFRSHMRVDAYLNEDRSVRTPEAKAQFIPWENDQKDSFARYLDEFVCEGKHASDFKPIDLDVDTYRKAILEAIKQGVIKD